MHLLEGSQNAFRECLILFAPTHVQENENWSRGNWPPDHHRGLLENALDSCLNYGSMKMFPDQWASRHYRGSGTANFRTPIADSYVDGQKSLELQSAHLDHMVKITIGNSITILPGPTGSGKTFAAANVE